MSLEETELAWMDAEQQSAAQTEVDKSGEKFVKSLEDAYRAILFSAICDAASFEEGDDAADVKLVRELFFAPHLIHQVEG